jgi:hypothetical protein
MKKQKVLKTEMRESTWEDVRKSTRHNYARGGYKIEETIYRRTIVKPIALLSCGHWREQFQSGAIVSTAKRLVCFVCEGQRNEDEET